jgi:hypothetical protein
MKLLTNTVLALAIILALPLLARGRVVGQWDFDKGDVRATVGVDMEYLDGQGGYTQTFTQFTTDTINGATANVMKFIKVSQYYPNRGYVFYHGTVGNGGTTIQALNKYTLIMDVKYPQGSSPLVNRALYKTESIPAVDGYVFIKASNDPNAPNGFGTINGYYRGTVSSNAWHRLAFTVDMDAKDPAFTDPNVPIIELYIDGVYAGRSYAFDYGDHPGNSYTDTRFAMKPRAALFTDNNGESETGYVNSIQLRDYAMSAAEIAALGGPSAAGIPQGLRADINHDGRVNSTDLMMLAASWLSCTDPNVEGCLDLR